MDSNVHELIAPGLGTYYCFQRNHDRHHDLWSQFERYYKNGYFCDVAIYCREKTSSRNLIKVACHSIVLGAFSGRVSTLLMEQGRHQGFGEAPQCQCRCDCRQARFHSENYSLVLPDSTAREVIHLLDTVYGTMARPNDLKDRMEVTLPLELVDALALKPSSVSATKNYESVDVEDFIRRQQSRSLVDPDHVNVISIEPQWMALDPEQPLRLLPFDGQTLKRKRYELIVKKSKKLKVVLERLPKSNVVGGICSLTTAKKIIGMKLRHSVPKKPSSPIVPTYAIIQPLKENPPALNEPNTVVQPSSSAIAFHDNSDVYTEVVAETTETEDAQKSEDSNQKVSDEDKTEEKGTDEVKGTDAEVHEEKGKSSDDQDGEVLEEVIEDKAEEGTDVDMEDVVPKDDKVTVVSWSSEKKGPISETGRPKSFVPILAAPLKVSPATPQLVQRLKPVDINAVFKKQELRDKFKSKFDETFRQNEADPLMNEMEEQEVERKKFKLMVAKTLPTNEPDPEYRRELVQTVAGEPFPPNAGQLDKEEKTKEKNTRYLLTKFKPQTRLKIEPLSRPESGVYSPAMIENIKASEGEITLVSANYDHGQTFTCGMCEKAMEEKGRVEKFVQHWNRNHKEKKTRIKCHICGEDQLLFINYISHVFKHNLFNYDDDSYLVALLGVGEKNGKNLACTLGCNNEEWDDENTIFNFLKMLEVIYKFSSEQLHEYFILETESQGKQAFAANIAEMKKVYKQYSGDQKLQLLNDLLSENGNMFEPDNTRFRKMHHIPSFPAFYYQVFAKFELVPGLSFDDITDVFIVMENKATSQLEAFSVVRMGFHCTQTTELKVRRSLIPTMAKVLAKLLRCPDESPETLKQYAGDVLQEYFQEYHRIAPVVKALKELTYDPTQPGGIHLMKTSSKRARVGSGCSCSSDLADPTKRKDHMMSFHGIDLELSPASKCSCRSDHVSIQAMLGHMKTVHHVDVPHFKCTKDSCNGVFLTQAGLEEHNKSGNHNVPCTCEQCGKVFSNANRKYCHFNLKHRPFTCKTCFKVINGQQPFTYHEKRCSVNTWNCHLCRQIMSDEESLTLHLTTEHYTQKPLTHFCNYCNMGFSRIGYMHAHARKVHNRPLLIATRGTGRTPRRRKL